MTITMNDSAMDSVSQIETFLQGTATVKFSGSTRDECYLWISETILRLKYFGLHRGERALVKRYLERVTEYSRAQVTRLIAQQKRRGKIEAKKGKRGTPFATTYTQKDIALLAQTDLAHQKLSGPATKEIFRRAYEVFAQKEFVRLKGISSSHLYNLRQKRQYVSTTKYFSKTSPTPTNIGERRKPQPEGKPGYLRVDTVHQGDDLVKKEKGVYHINMVDDVLQWEIVGAVETICDRDLVPLLEALIAQYPFRILGFHSDNGSEFINRRVAEMLNRLLIHQTKSRSRHCNDNALGESKNGSVIRKHMGYTHIERSRANAITEFYTTHFNPYLNYHRPSGYATIVMDAKGKEKKIYNIYQTPYARFLSLSSPEQYLKDGVTLEQLKTLSMKRNDNEAATDMQKAKQQLFQGFRISSTG